MSQELTDKQLIEKYISMRDLVAVKKKAFSEITKPYLDGMETIEKALMARLIQRGADNTKTEAGTAFKVTLLNVKVEDRQQFLSFILDQDDDSMLLAGAQKDAVKDYLEQNNAPPPGVSINYYTNVNVRKS